MSYQEKYLKYKNKYLNAKNVNQRGGEKGIDSISETDKCGLCSENIIDTCKDCHKHGMNYSPIPKTPNLRIGETSPRLCFVYIGKCGHVFHAHCMNKTKGICPLCDLPDNFEYLIAPQPDYVWCSGKVSSPKPTQGMEELDIYPDENGGKWKNIRLQNLIKLMKERKSIISYIMAYIEPDKYAVDPIYTTGLIKKYEDSIRS
jgi:hypothetical protein